MPTIGPNGKRFRSSLAWLVPLLCLGGCASQPAPPVSAPPMPILGNEPENTRILPDSPRAGATTTPIVSELPPLPAQSSLLPRVQNQQPVPGRPEPPPPENPPTKPAVSPNLFAILPGNSNQQAVNKDAPTPGTQHTPLPAAVHEFTLGLRMIRAHKLQQAVDEFDKAIAIDPQFALAYAKRGFAYNWLRMYEKGVKDCDKAISLQPDLAEAYRHRASAYSGLGQVKQSVDDVSRAIELDPKDFDAYWTRADSYTLLKDYKNVVADYTSAIKAAPDNKLIKAQLLQRRGAAYFELKDCNNAIADCSEAIKLDPLRIDAFQTRAQAYDKQGKHDLAKKDKAIVQRAMKQRAATQ